MSAEYPKPQPVCSVALPEGRRFIDLSWSIEARGVAIIRLLDEDQSNVGEVSCRVDTGLLQQCMVRLPEGSSATVTDVYSHAIGLAGVYVQVQATEPLVAEFSVRSSTVSILGGPWIITRTGTFTMRADTPN